MIKLKVLKGGGMDYLENDPDAFEKSKKSSHNF